MRRIEAAPGDNIQSFSKLLVDFVRTRGESVIGVFNEKEIQVLPGMTADQVFEQYQGKPRATGYAIYKYPLKCTDTQTIDLPIGAKALSVLMQDVPVLYAIVDLDVLGRFEEEKLITGKSDWIFPRTIQIRGTGHPLNFEWGAYDFVGTFSLGTRASLIFHVFASKV